MLFNTKIRETQNSRKYKRLRAQFLVKCRLAGGQEDPFVSNLKDLGAGGVRFWSDVHFPEGTILQLSMLVPPLDREIRTLGRVLRTRKARHGNVFYVAVGFVEITPSDQEALNIWIENLSKSSRAERFIDDADTVKRENPQVWPKNG